MNVLALLALALAPGVAISLYIYLKDKHEREPLWLLLVSFFYGGVSTIVTEIIRFPVNALMSAKDDGIMYHFIDTFFKVAFLEECSKFLFVRFILFYNKNFNEPFDGIVYAVMVSMGFATVENVLYVYQYGLATGILRMFTAVPAHAIFATIMGFFLGKAKFTHRRVLYYSVVGLLAASTFHGFYDFFLLIPYTPIVWIWVIVSMVIGFILSRKAIRLHQQTSPFI